MDGENNYAMVCAYLTNGDKCPAYRHEHTIDGKLVVVNDDTEVHRAEVAYPRMTIDRRRKRP